MHYVKTCYNRTGFCTFTFSKSEFRHLTLNFFFFFYFCKICAVLKIKGSGGSFPGGKAAGTWIWPLTSIWYRGQDAWSYTFTPSIRLHGVVLSWKT